MRRPHVSHVCHVSLHRLAGVGISRETEVPQQAARMRCTQCCEMVSRSLQAGNTMTCARCLLVCGRCFVVSSCHPSQPVLQPPCPVSFQLPQQLPANCHPAAGHCQPARTCPILSGNTGGCSKQTSTGGILINKGKTVANHATIGSTRWCCSTLGSPQRGAN
jgi:hypothetical protein